MNKDVIVISDGAIAKDVSKDTITDDIILGHMFSENVQMMTQVNVFVSELGKLGKPLEGTNIAIIVKSLSAGVLPSVRLQDLSTNLKRLGADHLSIIIEQDTAGNISFQASRDMAGIAVDFVESINIKNVPLSTGAPAMLAESSNLESAHE